MSEIQTTLPIVRQTTVTIQNVMIGKRQLTLRVFKQIHRESIFGDEPNELKGDAWGYINYLVDDFYERQFLWITKTGELRYFKLVLDPYSCEMEKVNALNNKHKDAIAYLMTLPQLYIAI